MGIGPDYPLIRRLGETVSVNAGASEQFKSWSDIQLKIVFYLCFFFFFLLKAHLASEPPLLLDLAYLSWESLAVLLSIASFPNFCLTGWFWAGEAWSWVSNVTPCLLGTHLLTVAWEVCTGCLPMVHSLRKAWGTLQITPPKQGVNGKIDHSVPVLESHLSKCCLKVLLME